MKLRRAVTSLFAVGFDGTEPTPDLLRLIDAGVRGVVLFARNVASAPQVQRLCHDLKAAAPGPLLIAIDQEGGRVARLREGFHVPPPMRVLGEIDDAALTRAVGQMLGEQLRAVGVDLNFAPVLDVDTNPANPVIGDRSFGPTPELVALHGVELLRGLQHAGVAACGKHFPGHGDTHQDSHLELPRLRHGLARLERVELPPFRAAIDAGVASIMTAHVVFEPIDMSVPATMSRRVIAGMLREQMGFGGVVISDDLEMKAIASHYGEPEAVVAGLRAGVDLFLCCHSAEVADRCIGAAVEAVHARRIDEDCITAACGRLDALQRQYVQGPASGRGLTASQKQRHATVLEQILAAAPHQRKPGADPTHFRGE